MSIGETLPRQIFPAGAQIFSEGDDGRFAYVIEGGQVEISTFNNGRRVVIARLENGELLGEMALVDDTPRSATAVAVEETQVVVIDRSSLQQYIDSADELVQLLLRVTLERLRAAQQVMLDETATTLGSKCRAGHARERDRLNSELQNAIDQELLDLHFQPIVRLSDGRVAGFEALVRWEHPEYGTVVPSSFIRVAEETGMILPMGRWMLRQALEAQKRLDSIAKSKPGSLSVNLNVNISSRQLLSAEEVQDLVDIVQQSGVDPRNITFEITESLMLEDPDHVADAMTRMRKQGIKIAADDFGTGYANLAFLNRFPLDVLKIDRSFITNMAAEPRSRKIVSTVIGLAKELGMSIVAEGIESAAEIDVLRDLDCDYGQGFLLSRPVPLQEAEALVKQRVRW